jgi:hypothetical protein
MGSNLLGEIAANNGTYILNSDINLTKTIDAIVVLEDTIFQTIGVNGVDVKATYLADPAIAIKAGAIITPINDLQFSNVRIDSGSIALVLG